MHPTRQHWSISLFALSVLPLLGILPACSQESSAPTLKPGSAPPKVAGAMTAPAATTAPAPSPATAPNATAPNVTTANISEPLGANELTVEQIGDGWILLFDGRTTFGWLGAETWTVNEGALVGAAEGTSVIFPFVSLRDYHLSYETSLVGADRWDTTAFHRENGTLTVTVNGEKLPLANPATEVGFATLPNRSADGKPVRYRNIKVKPLGLETLFNGKDLTGWKAIDPPAAKEPQLVAAWSVRDGLLHVEVPPQAGVSKGGRGHLESERTFQDFVLQVEARTNGSHLNSGIFFRTKPGVIGAGYEAQIRHQWEGDDRTKPVDFATGAIYRRVPARAVVADDNEFFTMTVVAQDRRLGVWVEGVMVTAFFDPRPLATATQTARDAFYPGAGTIALQAHDPTTNLDFRQVRIATLPSVAVAEPAKNTEASKDAATEKKKETDK